MSSYEYQNGRPHGMRYQEGPVAAALTGIYNLCSKVRSLLSPSKEEPQPTLPLAANDHIYGPHNE